MISMLDNVTEEVQLTGWHFNKEDNYLLSADSTGTVYIPKDIHRVTFFDASYPYVCRGNRIYDEDKGTYNIGHGVYAKVVKVLSFEDVPLSFQHYISIRAARKYQNNMLGAGSIRSFQERDEMEAKLVCMKEEQAISKPNIKGNILTGWSVAKTLRR